MDKQTREAKQMVKNMSFGKKLKHFWHYYKNHTFVVGLILLLTVVTVVQIITSEKYDLYVAYYGADYVTEEQAEMLEAYLEEYIEDADKNGEKSVSVSLVINDLSVPESEYSIGISQKFLAEVSAGINGLYIFDSKYYEYVGPQTDMGLIETAQLIDNEELKDILPIDKEKLYICRAYESSADNEYKIQLENAKIAEKVIKGEE